MRDLHDNMRRLIEERNKVWNKKKEIFRRETNYGLMELRHNMTQKHLKDMLSWLGGSKGKKKGTQDKSNGTPASRPKLGKKMQGENNPIKAQDAETRAKSREQNGEYRQQRKLHWVRGCFFIERGTKASHMQRNQYWAQRRGDEHNGINKLRSTKQRRR